MANESAAAAAGAAPQSQGPPSQPSTPECGKDSLERFVKRARHGCSGMRVGIDRCPDATLSRTATTAGVMGLAGAFAAFVLTRSPAVRLAVIAASALAGGLASRYHVSFDWDPDRAFGCGGEDDDDLSRAAKA